MKPAPPPVTLIAADPVLRRAVAEALAAHGLDLHGVATDGPGGDRTLAVPEERFRMGVLLDRVRQLSREGEDIPSLAFGPWVLSPGDGLLRRADGQGGEGVRLTEKERAILAALYALDGGVMDRRALLENVWEYAAGIETHTLETHIYRLRQKIEDDPAAPALLVTAGNGYVLKR